MSINQALSQLKEQMMSKIIYSNINKALSQLYRTACYTNKALSQLYRTACYTNKALSQLYRTACYINKALSQLISVHSICTSIKCTQNKGILFNYICIIIRKTLEMTSAQTATYLSRASCWRSTLMVEWGV